MAFRRSIQNPTANRLARVHILDPHRAYRKYVREGLGVAEDPTTRVLRHWVYGSEDFLRRMLSLDYGSDLDRHQASGRRFRSIIAEEIVDAVAAEHDVEPSDSAFF